MLFNFFMQSWTFMCLITHNKQLKELVNKDSYRAFTAWVMAKALLHYPFRARWTWRTCVCWICAMPNLLLFGLQGVLRIWTWLWPMTSVVTHIKWHQIHHRKTRFSYALWLLDLQENSPCTTMHQNPQLELMMSTEGLEIWSLHSHTSFYLHK